MLRGEVRHALRQLQQPGRGGGGEGGRLEEEALGGGEERGGAAKVREVAMTGREGKEKVQARILSASCTWRDLETKDFYHGTVSGVNWIMMMTTLMTTIMVMLKVTYHCKA